MWQLPAGYEVDLRAVDPIVARPAWVSPAAPTPETGVFDPIALRGDAAEAARAGSWTLVGADDPWSYVDRGLSLTPGEAALPGVLVQPELYVDSEVFEATISGLTWAMATQPGLSVVGIDVGLRARAEAPRRLVAGDDGAIVVLDGRGVHHAGDPGAGWQTSALEGATLRLLGPGEAIEL
jgi:hypothetical protein